MKRLYFDIHKLSQSATEKHNATRGETYFSATMTFVMLSSARRIFADTVALGDPEAISFCFRLVFGDPNGDPASIFRPTNIKKQHLMDDIFAQRTLIPLIKIVTRSF